MPVLINEVELPRYRSHKTVWALKIKEVNHSGPNPGAVMLIFERPEYAPREVSIINRPTPEAGWYFVVYPDGYHSFSPAKQFEEGNTPTDSEAHPHAKSADLRSFPQSDIENWFSYHAPTPEQIIQYGEIRTAAKIFAETINRHVPASADKTAAMRKLRDTVMAANLAVACFVSPVQIV